jgi:Delta3,5-Delta2,4-dienoyl-CoA isomerase
MLLTAHGGRGSFRANRKLKRLSLRLTFVLFSYFCSTQFHQQASRLFHTMSALQGYSGFKHFNVSSPSEFVAHVEINRPQKLNAFFEAMWIEVGQIFEKLSYDPDVRAIVLTGAGDRAFTAGLDVQAASESGLTSQAAKDGARAATLQRREILEFQECITKIEKCEKRK